jgi:tetratricopeptide (TPR) repeat protein
MQKTRKIITLASIFGIGLMAGVSATTLPVFNLDNTAIAQQQRQVKTRPKQNVAPQMTPEVFAIFEQAQLEVEAGNNFAARSLVETLLSRKGLSSYEMAMGYQMKGFIAYNEGDMSAALNEYRKILQFTDIPYGTTDAIRYTVAQLLSMEGRYDESLRELNEWFSYQPSPTPMNYFFKAQVHYQYGADLDKANPQAADAQFRLGIQEVENTMAVARQTGMEILENWYQIQSALYYQLEDYEAVRDILEIVIVKWPRPGYWTQLSAMYSELKQFDRQLAVLDVAYRLGFLEKEQNLITVAQLYSINGIPYLAAKVMEDGMKKTKKVDGEDVPVVDPEDEDNLTLLGQSYLVGRDYDLATEPLGKAAEMSEDGKLYLQLGSVYSTMEDWRNAAASLQKAIDKGELDDPEQAYLYLGLAYVNFRDFTKAEEAFRSARRMAGSDDQRVRRQVDGWLRFIVSEKARLKRLADAGITPTA